VASPAIKHIVDLAWDIELSTIDIDNLKAVVCDKAWHELPEVLTLKDCPAFSFWQTLCLEALQGQDGQDQGLTCSWTSQGDCAHCFQQAASSLRFQWTLKCLGGHEFLHACLSTGKTPTTKARTPQSEDEQDAGWDFFIGKWKETRGRCVGSIATPHSP
jgi:hypothetical protein